MYRNSELTPETLEAFPKAFEGRLGVLHQRALKMAQEYGQMMFEELANMLLFAADQGKVENVLQVLEQHYEAELKDLPIEKRGVTTNIVNSSAQVFGDICIKILGFKLGRVGNHYELCPPEQVACTNG